MTTMVMLGGYAWLEMLVVRYCDAEVVLREQWVDLGYRIHTTNNNHYCTIPPFFWRVVVAVRPRHTLAGTRRLNGDEEVKHFECKDPEVGV